MTDAFRSNPDHCGPFEGSGWLCLGNGWLISKLPFWDHDAGLWARLGHGPATELLAKMGGRLPTPVEYDQLHIVALHIDPFTLPTAAMLRAAGVDVRDSRAIDRYRNANMMSRAWCEIHDTEVARRLNAASEDWIGRSCANVGKHFAHGGIIYGWFKANGGMIQRASLAHEHEPTFCDYATTTHGCIRAEAPWGPQDEPPGPSACEPCPPTERAPQGQGAA